MREQVTGAPEPPRLDVIVAHDVLGDLADERLVAHPDRHDAFTVLYGRYAPLILAYCRLRITDPNDAEDVAAQIFANAWRGFPPDDRGTFRAWLFTIAHHAVVNHYRKQGARGPTRPLDDGTSDAIRDPDHSPEAVAVHNDEASELRRALAHLGDDQRQVIELRLGGLKGREIAAVLGRSESAIKMIQFRAMQRLREILVAESRAQPSDHSQGKELADAH